MALENVFIEKISRAFLKKSDCLAGIEPALSQGLNKRIPIQKMVLGSGYLCEGLKGIHTKSFFDFEWKFHWLFILISSLEIHSSRGSIPVSSGSCMGHGGGYCSFGARFNSRLVCFLQEEFLSELVQFRIRKPHNAE
ncbi:hypothetical protein HPP92_007215 [Vanilla planifolia]|uniref:Uncharacterized protein n=1 Tax=Vanilla planifolia TaxID=51239 RepID=A0A835RC85_VANPL|nr:hypothetical protein HPP92_007215 [Vanilla planifolia]